MNSLSPETPVLVGIGITAQRCSDPFDAKEAWQLMADAVSQAADDAGSRELLTDCELMLVPQGLWQYSDPARLIAERLGAKRCKTVLAKVGILQQTLMGEACGRIAAGELDIAIVTGGEAKYRQLLAGFEQITLSDTQQHSPPDEVLEPIEEMFLDIEAQAGLFMPVGYYALIESAIRAHRGLAVEQHRDELARLYSRFSDIAAGNPHAWKPQSLTMEQIRNASDKNPMLAFPYTKLHNSDWNVDQACALVFCSVAKAEALGIDRDKWIYPLASVTSNHMVQVTQRRHLHRSVGGELALTAALSAAGLRADQLDLLDMYSCFPACVQVYAEALGITDGRDLTFTGGMPFAGGPLNNYVLQATCRLVELLRAGQGRFGLVSATSGILYKQGFGLFGREPASAVFQCLDVTGQAARQDVPLTLCENYRGPARIVACTVLFQKNQAERAIVIADIVIADVAIADANIDVADAVIADVSGHAGGGARTPVSRTPVSRTIAYSQNEKLMQDMMREEFCGRSIVIDNGTFTMA